MKISIITPSFNYGRFIAEAIESVAEQDYPDVEHIVVDGGSTDSTLDVLRAYEHLPHLRWISEPDRGQTHAINKGFRMATGEVVAWLNADDAYLPNTFHRVADRFAREPDADFVYGDTLYIDEAGNDIRVKYEHVFDYGVLFYYGCYIQTTSSFFKRAIIQAGHELDEHFHNGMDYEFFVRLAHAGYQFAYIPDVLGAFRWHDQNLTLVHDARKRKEDMIVKRQYGLRLPLPERAERLVHRFLREVFRAKRVVLKKKAHPEMLRSFSAGRIVTRARARYSP